MEKIYPHENKSLKTRTHKLTLLLLITGHRIQTISVIKTDYIPETQSGIQILIPGRLKTSSINVKQPCLQIPFLSNRPGHCVASLLKHYVDVTKQYKNMKKCNLFLTHKQPHTVASKLTISAWTTLHAGGIDNTIFRNHSVRHASTSAANRKGVSLEVIQSTAGWSNSSQTFRRLYNLPILEPTVFALNVLDTST